MRDNLNKRLAHFTSIRWRENPPSMDYYAARFSEVSELIDKFFKLRFRERWECFFAKKMDFWRAQYQVNQS